MFKKNRCRVLFLCLGFLLVAIRVLAMDNLWRIMINIPEYRLYLYHNGELVKTYKVAVGKINSPSPTGEFQIINKVINPTWYPEGRPPVPPGPNNPLGRYWMGLNNKGYGIHGNSAAWSIGNPVSKGCFRMDNHEIEELFTLAPVGTQVKVIYEPIKSKIDQYNQAWLEIYPDIYHRFKSGSKLQQVIAELNWQYQPHLWALACLINSRKQEVMIPRKINIEFDYKEMELDGFYWNNRVYLSKNFWDSNNPSDNFFDDEQFPGYISWEALGAVKVDRFKLEWDPVFNTLMIHSIKVRINGETLNNAARFGKSNNVLINYSKLSEWFDEKQLPKPVMIIQSPEGRQLAGEYYHGELWVDPEVIFSNSSVFSYLWDEAKCSLDIYYWPE